MLTDHAADVLFAPTAVTAGNLKREGLPEWRIFNVGDVMYDAALFYLAKSDERSAILDSLRLTPKEYILATVHRAENTDDPERLAAIFEALMLISDYLPVVIPLHPRTRKALDSLGLLACVNSRLIVTEPLGYLDMVMLQKMLRSSCF